MNAPYIKKDDQGFPPLWIGFQRHWVKCKSCGNVAYYDFVPFSFPNLVMTLPCGHGAAQKFSESVEHISPEQALVEIYKESLVIEEAESCGHL
jgi:hypothetical protein